MQWNSETGKWVLQPADLTVMQQCNIPLEEVLCSRPHNPDIPPLWSVLSYAMLTARSNNDRGIWMRYRRLTQMEKQANHRYLHCRIPKRGGGVRDLYVPDFFLKREQRLIFENILSGLTTDPHAYAYKKHVRLQDCAHPHTQQDVLIRIDLKNFFGSVTTRMVCDALQVETGYPLDLCLFLARLCCFRGRLPQGAVTSPILSNIAFRRYDQLLARLAENYQVRYTRYSDDLYFSGSRKLNVDKFITEVTVMLTRFGFTVNPEKTTVRRRHHRQTVLGMTVNEKVRVTRQYRRDLLQELYYLQRFGRKCNGAVAYGDYYGYMQHLQGKLVYALATDPDNRKLLDAQDALRRRMITYQIFPD